MQCTLVASWIACAWSGMECGALSKAHTQLLIKDNSFCWKSNQTLTHILVSNWVANATARTNVVHLCIDT